MATDDPCAPATAVTPAAPPTGEATPSTPTEDPSTAEPTTLHIPTLSADTVVSPRPSAGTPILHTLSVDTIVRPPSPESIFNILVRPTAAAAPESTLPSRSTTSNESTLPSRATDTPSESTTDIPSESTFPSRATATLSESTFPSRATATPSESTFTSRSDDTSESSIPSRAPDAAAAPESNDLAPSLDALPLSAGAVAIPAATETTEVSIPPTTTCLLDQVTDAPQHTAGRPPTAAHPLAPTSDLPHVDIDIDASTDADLPPHIANDVDPSARFAAPLPPEPIPDARANLSRQEQTGETGIYVERLRRDTFNLSTSGPDGPDDLPDLETNAESGWQYVTGHHPPSLRRFLLFRALPAGLLIAVTAWSWMLIRSGDRTAPRAYDIPTDTGTPVDAATPPPALPAPAAPALATADDDDDETIAALKLLDSYAESVAANETVGKLQLKHAISQRKVTVVNLWATWCAPCLNELPFLKDAFKLQEWKDVEFIPLLVFDSKSSRAAYRDHAADMPPFDHFLADRDLSSGPKAALIADKRLPDKFDLPVTILFNCQRKIHKIYRDAFNTPEKFHAFVQDVENLRAKLDSPACRPPPAPRPDPQFVQIGTPSTPPATTAVSPTTASTPATKPKGPSCGDGVCDRKTETCECAKDCPCSPKETCKFRADSGSACVTRTKIGI